MSIVFGVALSLIVSDKLISVTTYNKEMQEDINKEIRIIK